MHILVNTVKKRRPATAFLNFPLKPIVNGIFILFLFFGVGFAFTSANPEDNPKLIRKNFSGVTIRAILEELSSEEGFELLILGDVEQNVSLALDDMTLEESIHKLMRATNLDYLIVFEKTGSKKRDDFRIETLIVYEKAGGRSRGPAPERLETRIETEPNRPEPLDYGQAPGPAGQRRLEGGGQTGSEFEGDPEQIKDYLQNLAKDGKISPQEYEDILESMENRAAEP
jgi:hypothetical protein